MVLSAYVFVSVNSVRMIVRLPQKVGSGGRPVVVCLADWAL